MISIGDSDWDEDSDEELMLTRNGYNNNNNHVADFSKEIDEILDTEDLQTATSRGNFDVVKHLTEPPFNVDIELRTGWTLLMYALEGGHCDIVQYYLQRGADVNYHYQMFYPLMAAFLNAHLPPDNVYSCIEMLLEKSVNVNVHDKHHVTPLMMAGKQGYAQCVGLLCKHNVDINKQDQRGWTALMYAANENKHCVVDVLLEHKASPFAHTFDGQTCADLAHDCGHQKLYEFLENIINPEQTTFKTPQVMSTSSIENPVYNRLEGIEMFLTGKDLGNLIPLFQEQKIDFATLLNMNRKDLERVGVSQFGIQQKILESIRSVHTSEWEMPDQSATLFSLELNSRDAAKVMKVYAKHLRYLNATAQYLVEQIGSSRKLAVEYDTNAVEDSGIIDNFRTVYGVQEKIHKNVQLMHSLLSEKLNRCLVEKECTDVTMGSPPALWFVLGIGCGVLLALAPIKFSTFLR